MGTGFEIKPINGSDASMFPEAIPSNSDNKTTVSTDFNSKNSVVKSKKNPAIQKSQATTNIDIKEMYIPENSNSADSKKIKSTSADITNTKINTPATPAVSKDVPPVPQKNNLNTIDETQDQEIITIDVDFIVKQIQDVLKSPSPWTLYQKSTQLKEDFAQFINYLVKKIALGFNSESKTIILSLYQNAKYEQIWFENLKTYLDEAKYFDVRMYFKALTKFDKDKQYIAKTLLKLKGKVADIEIEKYLKKFEAKTKLPQIKSYYRLLKIDDLVITNPKYLDENKIDVFLENLYFNCDDLGMLFQIFCFDLDQMKGKFKDIYSIFSDIARSYLKNVSPKTKQIYEYLHNEENKLITTSIDKHIYEYTKNKKMFYRGVASLLTGKNSIERSYFWAYVKTKMIDTYFEEVARLFYWDKDACSNRNEWSNLRGNFTYNPNTEYATEINEILQFKKLILELNTNIFAPFFKPLVYSIVSEKLSINRKDLLKIRYLMTLVLSENYQEYKKIYNFFEDLEAFMDYNVESLIGFNFGKIKIFMADIMICIAGLFWLYFYSPVGVFVSSLILSISYIRSHFFKFRKGIEWNLGVKPIATGMLIVSTFYWITNLDTTKLDIAKLSSKVEKIGIYKTDVATKVAIQKIDKSGIKQAVADILQFKKK